MTKLMGTAVVTGGASGIGLALARRFAAAGMNIVLADVEEGRLEEAAASLGITADRLMTVPTDVSDDAQVQRLAQRSVERFGGVRILCNNAGVETGGWFADIPHPSWHWVLGVNMGGVINGCRAFLPILRAEPEAHIVNTGSQSSFDARNPLTFAPYAASKFAVLALSESLAAEFAARGDRIGVSVLAPGPVRTDMTRAERNRPDDVPSSAGTGIRDDVIGAITRITDEIGMSADDAAELVARAIERDTFFVLTHPEMAFAAMELRLDAMRAAVTPETAR